MSYNELDPVFTKWTNSAAEGSLLSQTLNYGVIGMSDMSITHDYLSGYWAKQYPEIPISISNQGSILPVYLYNSYGLIGKPFNMLQDYLVSE